MKKPDWIKAIDEAIEAKQRIYAMNSQDRDRRKMDTVPMTAIRRMSEIESLQSRNQALTARVRQLESELARLQSRVFAVLDALGTVPQSADVALKVSIATTTHAGEAVESLTEVIEHKGRQVDIR